MGEDRITIVMPVNMTVWRIQITPGMFPDDRNFLLSRSFRTMITASLLLLSTLTIGQVTPPVTTLESRHHHNSVPAPSVIVIPNSSKVEPFPAAPVLPVAPVFPTSQYLSPTTTNWAAPATASCATTYQSIGQATYQATYQVVKVKTKVRRMRMGRLFAGRGSSCG